MNRTTITALATAAALTGAAIATAPDSVDRAADDPTQVLSFTVDRIDGSPEQLDMYLGKVVLIVNTASKCGLTPQYEELQTLYETYEDLGFVVLGFPANNFAGQEPGTNEEIAQFCDQNYGVTFPMYSKISVKGDDQHPLYKKLTSAPAPIGGEVQWNFQKYLVDRTGHVVQMYGSRTKPSDEAFTAKIEELIAQ